MQFRILSEGERGLLGVGFAPARVIASLPEPPAAAAAPAAEEEGSAAAVLRELLERVTAALGAPVLVAIREDAESLVATLSGPDLGLVIGKRGQTIDAIQALANAIVRQGGEGGKDVIVDAAGYRDRRRVALEREADRAASEAVREGTPVALEPMTAVERKIVHLHLHGREDVETESEGTEPHRHVVVRPA